MVEKGSIGGGLAGEGGLVGGGGLVGEGGLAGRDEGVTEDGQKNSEPDGDGVEGD